jgi:site-specific DNA recombinase
MWLPFFSWFVEMVILDPAEVEMDDEQISRQATTTQGTGAPPLAAVYVRVSAVGTRDRQSASYQTEEEQETRCRAYADARGYRVVEVTSDIDVSGGTWERDGLERVLTLAESGQIRALIVYRLSRLGRGLRGVLETVERLRDAGVALMSVSEGIDLSTASGRMLFNVMASFDQYERELRGEYWAGVKTRARARGVLIGPTPFGYRRHDGGARAGVLFPCPDRGPVVRRLFEERAGGASLSALARVMDRESPREDEKAWSTTQASRILRSRVYRGEVRQAGEVVADAHEPLVDEALWRSAQRVRVQRPSASQTADFLLSGIVCCDGCGRTMAGQATGGADRRTPVYRCRRRSADGDCEAPSVIVAGRLEEYVANAVLTFMRSREATGAPVGDSVEEIKQLDAAADAADDEVRAWIEDPALRTLLGDREWRIGLESRVRERDERRRDADEARSRVEGAEALAVTADDVADDRALLRAALRGAVRSLRVRRGRGLSVEQRVDLVLGQR